MNELRFYTFVNCELRTIQQGVQSFHVGHEMFMKYDPANSYTQSNEESAFIFESELRLKDWARNHKTLIILNGGGNTDINDKYCTLEKLSKTLGFRCRLTSSMKMNAHLAAS